MRRALVLFGRAFFLRCPNCGGGGLFRSWFSIKSECPTCELRIERESGSFTGSMTINLVVTEIVWVVALVAMLIATWPSPPVILLQWGSILLMVLFPLLFFRHAKTLWLAFDLVFRPAATGER